MFDEIPFRSNINVHFVFTCFENTLDDKMSHQLQFMSKKKKRKLEIFSNKLRFNCYFLICGFVLTQFNQYFSALFRILKIICVKPEKSRMLMHTNNVAMKGKFNEILKHLQMFLTLNGSKATLISCACAVCTKYPVLTRV